MRTLRGLLVACTLIALVGGCAPSLSPLYRDYRPAAPDTAATSLPQVQAALKEAGWSPASSNLSHAVTTRPRTVRNWGLYTIEVSLEAVPMSNGSYVRLFVHPYRDYIIGGKSKMSYFPSGLRSTLLPPLNEAFKQHGFQVIGTPFERNEMERQ